MSKLARQHCNYGWCAVKLSVGGVERMSFAVRTLLLFHLLLQTLLVTPSTVYVAGTDRQLHQYSFQLALLHSFEVTAESAFGVAHDPGSGMLAVCGSRGCLDLLSAEGNSLGHIAPPASVFVPAP